MFTFLQALGRKPIFGFVGSLLGITMTHLQALQIIGAVIGIVIAVITAIIKILELKEKLSGKKKRKTPVRKKKKPTLDPESEIDDED